jgi:hypothetical protein
VSGGLPLSCAHDDVLPHDYLRPYDDDLCLRVHGGDGGLLLHGGDHAHSL